MTRLTLIPVLFFALLTGLAPDAHASDWVEFDLYGSTVYGPEIDAHLARAKAYGTAARKARDVATFNYYTGAMDLELQAARTLGHSAPDTHIRFVGMAPNVGLDDIVAAVRSRPELIGGTVYVYSWGGQAYMSATNPLPAMRRARAQADAQAAAEARALAQAVTGLMRGSDAGGVYGQGTAPARTTRRAPASRTAPAARAAPGRGTTFADTYTGQSGILGMGR